MNRRKFLMKNTIALAAAPLIISAGLPDLTGSKGSKRIQFTRDGLDLSPEEYSELLTGISAGPDIVDNYSNYGVVEKMENKFAEMLGMESGIFMPTGTLANNIALMKHAGNNRRVLLQSVSHIYNDTGDGAQTLCNLNLIPLAPGKTSFTLDDVRAAVDRTRGGRVKTGIGVISIESPVRRKNNEMFDYREMELISEYARSNGIKMHLDGARLFNAVAHSGISAPDFANLFDTVYISLYKDFNAASGAVLCGTKKFTEGLYHTRRMFGGGMPQAWPFAAVALHYADSFLTDYKDVLERFSAFSKILNREKEFQVSLIENGTNVFRMLVDSTDPEYFRSKLAMNNVDIPAPAGNVFYPKTNTTLLRIDPVKLAGIFIDSIKQD
jgi:threonine aldolase